jgi:hypothetical protein
MAEVASVTLLPCAAVRTRARAGRGEDERTKGTPAMHAIMLRAVSDVVTMRHIE